ncbi:hypothetical protein GCM10017557_29490 [Streptomyces aurantiacus]|uniref:Tyr recombinase domain-containing protein n=1 Tax=Streptomyces aurantiacus TaxID=47760 RepID=A0A7G1P2E1_9ACTN|nr:hypothetical protein GCM10017557_29490 [Streptomyces aurantiacus]
MTRLAQGGSLDPTNLTRAFTTPLRKAGLRRIRFHDLRHSTDTLLLEQGIELVVIKELLGHALRNPTETADQPDDGNYPPPCVASAVTAPKPPPGSIRRGFRFVLGTCNRSHLCSSARAASEFHILIEQAASKRGADIVKNHNEQRCTAHWKFPPS